MLLKCNLCSFKALDPGKFARHIQRHLKDPSERHVSANCPQCGNKFQQGRTWLRHFKAFHQSSSCSHASQVEAEEAGPSSIDGTNQNVGQTLEKQGTVLDSTGSARHLIGNFMLQMQAQYGVPKGACPYISGACQDIIQHAVQEYIVAESRGMFEEDIEPQSSEMLQNEGF